MYAATPILPPVKIDNDVSCGGILRSRTFRFTIVFLFVFAAMVVLSLIPLYIPQKSATRSVSSQKSTLITMYVNTGSASSKRKRSTSPLSSYVNGQLSAGSTASVEAQLTSVATSDSSVDSVSVSSVTVSQSSSKRRRSSLVKRQSSAIIFLVIQFYVKFKRACDYQCTIIKGPKLEAKFKNGVTSSSLPLSDLTILYPSGQYWGIVRGQIPIYGVSAITPIVPGSYPSNRLPQGQPIPTASVAIPTTTTVAAG